MCVSMCMRVAERPNVQLINYGEHIHYEYVYAQTHNYMIIATLYAQQNDL